MPHKIIRRLTHYTKNFSRDELRCQHCGRENLSNEFREFMEKVQELRDEVGEPLGVSSGYRCPNHPIEADKVAKGKPLGHHTEAAIDLKCYGSKAHKVLEVAMKLGFTGIGINQKGEYGQRFIHLDMRNTNPTVWSY